MTDPSSTTPDPLDPRNVSEPPTPDNTPFGDDGSIDDDEESYDLLPPPPQFPTPAEMSAATPNEGAASLPADEPVRPPDHKHDEAEAWHQEGKLTKKEAKAAAKVDKKKAKAAKQKAASKRQASKQQEAASEVAAEGVNDRRVRRARKRKSKADRILEKEEERALREAEKKRLAQMTSAERKAEKERKKEQAKQRKAQQKRNKDAVKAELKQNQQNDKDAKRRKASKTKKVKAPKAEKERKKEKVPKADKKAAKAKSETKGDRRVEKSARKTLKQQDKLAAKIKKQQNKKDKKSGRGSKQDDTDEEEMSRKEKRLTEKQPAAERKKQKADKGDAARINRIIHHKNDVHLDRDLLEGEADERNWIQAKIAGLLSLFRVATYKELFAQRTAGEVVGEVGNRAKERELRKKLSRVNKRYRVPKRGAHKVVLWDGAKLVVTTWDRGLISHHEEWEYKTPEAALTAVRKIKNVKRLIIGDYLPRANVKNPEIHRDPVRQQAEMGQINLTAYQAGELGDKKKTRASLLLSGGSRAISLVLPESLRDDPTIKQHHKRLLPAAVCVGKTAGAWLRVGATQTEMAFVNSEGVVVRSVSMRDSHPRDTGVDYINSIVEAGTPTGGEADPQELRRETAVIADWVREQIAEHTESGDIITALHIHGFGEQMLTLNSALETALTDVAILRGYSTLPPPQRAVWNEAIKGQIEAVVMLSAWAAPLMSDPLEDIRLLRVAKQKRVAKRVAIAALCLSVVMAGITVLGARRHSRILAAQEREATAQTALDEIAALPQLSTTGGLTELQTSLGCAELATDIQDPATVTAAVPLYFAPEVWPDGWYDTLLEWGLSAELLGTFSNRVEVETNIATMKQMLTDNPALVSLPAEEINAAFVAAELDPSIWRKNAWRSLHFSAERITYEVPINYSVCASTGRDLLSTAQNAPLIGALISRQLQEVPRRSTLGHPHWITSDTVEGSDFAGTYPLVTLDSQFQVLEYTDLTVFGAAVLDDVLITDTLIPLATTLWGADGAVRLQDSPNRRCDNLGATSVCGADISVLLGRRHLVERNDWQDFVSLSIPDIAAETVFGSDSDTIISREELTE